MADASQLEADLLAALGAMPEPEKLAPTEIETLQHHQTDPTQAALAEPPAVPPSPPAPPAPHIDLHLPPVPPPPAPASPAQAPVSAPTQPAASTPPTAAPSAAPAPSIPVASTATQPSSNISSPQPTQLAQQLAPCRVDSSFQAFPQAAAPGSQNATGLRSPKRARSPDGLVDGSIKRQRIDQVPQKGDITIEAPSLDLAAMLNDALANFDQQVNPDSSDLMMPDADMEQPVAPITITPEPEKPENKIMKASINPFYVMRSMSLPVLGNIAVQILLRLSQQPRTETQSLLTDPSSEFRKAYDMLRDIFRPTRKAFSDSPLLSPDELDITDSEDRETIRMSNLAAAAASVFGANDVPLNDIHEAFFSIFVPEDGEYKASLTEALICLKTRLFLEARDKPEQAQWEAQLLDTLFPVNFDETLKQRSGDLMLSLDEEGLVAQIRERREALTKSTGDESLKKTLEDQSSPEKFAESFSVVLQGHLGVVVDYAEKYGVNIPLNEEETTTTRDLNSAEQQEHDSLAALLESATSHLPQTEEADVAQLKDVLSEALNTAHPGSAEDEALDLKKLIEQSLSSHIPELKDTSTDQNASNGIPDFDSKNLASLISEKLKSDLEIPTHGLPNPATPVAPNTATHPQYLAQLSHTHQSPYQSYPQNSTPTAPVGPAGEILPPNQSMPTAALYEKARQAAVAKSSNTTRREGLHSTRRPWTPEEEKALMAGLDMVKGPHWSQILSLFGQHGTISDILKDRTQVQLKDKARNLKLFFLKTNSEMPYYLQSVTGELKTRAPSQAARKEAEEKARMNLEEEQARIQGIMTLAGGLQNNHHPVANSPLAASPVKRTSPITPGVGGVAGVTTAGHGVGSSVSNLPPVPISPRVKTEPSDHHSLSKPSFPPIQPAPAPGSAMQQTLKPHLPPLQPQSALQHQQLRQQQQQHQYQQPQQHRPQDAQRVPLPQQQQQQQQVRQPLPQQPHHPAQTQSQPQAQSSPQPPTQPKPQQQPQQQVQPQPQSQAQTQPHVQTQPPPPSHSPPQHQSHPQTQQQQQQQQRHLQSQQNRPQAPPNNTINTTPPLSHNINTQSKPPVQNQIQPQPQPRPQQQQQPQSTQTQPPAFPMPTIPPTHHSTPDHANDTEFFAKLQAAIADSTANETAVGSNSSGGTGTGTGGSGSGGKPGPQVASVASAAAATTVTAAAGDGLGG